MSGKRRKRLEYINMELSHARYHDGWVVAGLIKEKKELEKCLDLVKEVKNV